MNLHDHKEKIVSAKANYSFSSIEELSDQIIEAAIASFEYSYSKDSMTNGELPILNLVKAIYRFRLHDCDLDSTRYTYKDFFESLEKELQDYKEIEKFEAKDIINE